MAMTPNTLPSTPPIMGALSAGLGGGEGTGVGGLSLSFDPLPPLSSPPLFVGCVRSPTVN